MKEELHLDNDDHELMIIDLLLAKGWHWDRGERGGLWRHPRTGFAFTLYTAAKIAGVYPGDENDSGRKPDQGV